MNCLELSLKFLRLCGRLLHICMSVEWAPFWCSGKFDEGWWKLNFCLLFVIDIRIWLYFLLLTTNKRSDIYCDWRGRIFQSLSKSRNESVLLHPVIILSIFFYLKIVALCEEFPQNINPYCIMEWKQISYYLFSFRRSVQDYIIRMVMEIVTFVGIKRWNQHKIY
jgi:hypothetical protein